MKTIPLCFLLPIFLCLACLVSAESDKPTQAARVYQAGLKALARKENRNAFEAFQRAVKLDASLAEAHYQLGVLYGQQSQWNPAVQAFQTAIHFTPDLSDAHCRLGEAYLIGLARAKDAIQPLKHALQLKPDTPSARRLLGTAYLRQNQIKDAIHYLKQAVQYTPEDIEARYLLGLAHFQAEDFSQAIPHFEIVIQRQKRHSKAHFNLGTCYLRTGKIASGRTALRTFEKLNSEEEQLARLRRLILAAPQQLEPRYQLAELLIKREDWDMAVVELKTCLAISPHDEKASELLGYIYLQTEAYPEALAVYGQLVEAQPQSAVYRNSLGIVYMMLKKPRQAIVQLETATRLNATNPQLYRNLANAYQQVGEQGKAAQVYQRYRALTKD